MKYIKLNKESTIPFEQNNGNQPIEGATFTQQFTLRTQYFRMEKSIIIIIVITGIPLTYINVFVYSNIPGHLCRQYYESKK